MIATGKNIPNDDSNPSERQEVKDTILLIDDDQKVRAAISAMLSTGGGYNVLLASDGMEGIASAKEHIPDLVLCDIMMPNMDGYQVFHEFRKESATATIPFIFLTALASSSDLQKGMEFGVDDYLTKPITLKALLKRVSVRLERSRQLRIKRLQDFTQHLVSIQEYERRRVAKVLQNQVYEALMGLKLTLSLGENAPIKSQESIYKDALGLVDELIQQIDDLSYDLHPPMLDHLGLLPALIWLANRYSMDVELQPKDLSYGFDPEVKTALFRLIQEALDNVEKHAEAQKVVVKVENKQSHLYVVIEDDGIGFDLEKTLQSKSATGLMSMYERMSSLDGDVNIKSVEEQGTIVSVRLPLSNISPEPKRAVSNAEIEKLLAQSLQQNKVETVDSDITVAIASEQALLCKGLRRLLERDTNFHCVAEVNRLDRVRAAIAEHKPDLLVIDILEDGEVHYDTIQKAIEKHIGLNVLVISPHREESYVIDAFQNGAKGFVPKDTTTNDLYTAISNVGRGQLYLSPTISSNKIIAQLES